MFEHVGAEGHVPEQRGEVRKQVKNITPLIIWEIGQMRLSLTENVCQLTTLAAHRIP